MLPIFICSSPKFRELLQEIPSKDVLARKHIPEKKCKIEEKLLEQVESAFFVNDTVDL